MAKKTFSADSKLGFMRFIVVLNLQFIAISTFMMLFVRGSSVHLDFSIMILVAELLSMAVAIWLILSRKIYARQIIIGLLVFQFLMGELGNALSGTISLAGVLSSAVLYGLLILYFATSRRAKAVLVQPFDSKLRDARLTESIKLWNPKQTDFWMRLLIYFFFFSIAGHWMEMGLQILIIHGLFPGTIALPDSLTWRDSLNPFFIYGIAVAFCGLALHPLYLWLRKKMPRTWMAFALSFLVNTLFCTFAELALGLAFNADLSAWDYSDQFMNFQGQICLLYTTAFGILSSLITWFLYPAMEIQLSRLGRDSFRMVFVVCLMLFILIVATYNFDPDFFFGPDFVVDAS